MMGPGIAASVAAFAVFLSGVVHAAAAEPPDWENPKVFGIGKEPPRATTMVYPDARSALRAERDASPYFRSLNGSWKFHWAPDPAGRPREFHRATGNCTDTAHRCTATSPIRSAMIRPE
jgi:hypothetical protein